jgi:hypothetical protein
VFEKWKGSEAMDGREPEKLRVGGVLQQPVVQAQSPLLRVAALWNNAPLGRDDRSNEADRLEHRCNPRLRSSRSETPAPTGHRWRNTLIATGVLTLGAIAWFTLAGSDAGQRL